MKEILKFLVFRILCPLLVVAGVSRILRRLTSHRRLIIFFHGVSRKKHYHINGRHMDLEQFEQLLKYLKRNFDILSVEDLCESRNSSAALSRKRIALSFDDGFQNNIDVALPLLEKHKIPATFFISSISLDDPRYIHPSDLIDLLKTTLTTEEVSINGEKFHLLENELVRLQDGQVLLEYLNNLPFAELQSAVKAIRTTFGYEHLTQRVDPECYRLISADTLRAIGSHDLITVASHGHYHVNMARLSVAELNEQLSLSRQSLEHCTKLPVTSLAFPYGHFSEATVETASKNGFKYLFAGGDVTSGATKIIPRVGVLSMRGFAFNILSINRAFARFGF